MRKIIIPNINCIKNQGWKDAVIRKDFYRKIEIIVSEKPDSINKTNSLDLFGKIMLLNSLNPPLAKKMFIIDYRNLL